MYSMEGIVAERYETLVELWNAENNVGTYTYSDHVPQMFDFKLECHCHEHNHDHEEHHHHHDHDEECHCHDHEHEHHHHENVEECHCHDHHDHEHHHHHHADEVFTSWGRETIRAFSVDEITSILNDLQNSGKYGFVLRAKGIVASNDGEWIHFDYVPGEPDVRRGASAVTGKICVIGSGLDEDEVATLFGVN